MKKFFSLSFALLFTHLLCAQQTIEGTVVNKETKEPLAFANITYNQQSKKGVISDIDGKFLLQSKDSVTSIEINYLGFESLQVYAPFEEPLLLALEASEEMLEDVIVYKGENPALAIIQKVIDNKDLNNPEKMGGFTYTSYNKTTFDFNKNAEKKRDSLAQAFQTEMAEAGEDFQDTLSINERIIKNLGFYPFMMESVSEKKFLPPSYASEKVVATKVTGIKNPYFAVLATEIQPFGFYEEFIPLLDMNFLNPIANGSLKRYDFQLEKSLVEGNHLIHIISFQPKKGKNFDGLVGFMHVHTQNYAIQNIVAEPQDEMMIRLKIQQQYQPMQNQRWFPSQLNFEMGFESGIYVNGKTYLSDIEFTDDLSRRDFSEVVISYADDAPKKTDDFWTKYRANPLNELELNSYKIVDSIGEKLKLDKVIDFSTRLADGRIKMGVVDFRLNHLFGFNRYEGFRLGGGLETNEKIHKNLRLGGYFGYGFRDGDLKYGADFQWRLSKKNQSYLNASYTYDVREIGQSGMQRKTQENGDLRDFIASTMDFVEQIEFSFTSRAFKYVAYEVGLRQEQITPMYDFYTFQTPIEDIRAYTNTQLNFNLRYAHGERFMENFRRRISLGTKHPIFRISYAYGLDDFWDGQFNYHKAEASVTQSFFTKQFGKTRYHLQAGYIDQSIPLGLLFTGDGSNDSDIPIVMYDTFQTMLPYEFVSNQYVHLFLTHDIGGLLFKSGSFQPGVILHHNMGWGDLTERGPHSIPFNTMDQIYTESGIELTKLYKINYLNAYYLGLGIGGFLRYGNYAFDGFSDNFVVKMNVSFSFK
ncbi:MAG: DUF5686 and carboxypeptidase regulatory-like domain-containing protein [Flavobacteriaceae bacterium]|nr:DUF5686 and carboxypeptidase regulatory-like domain-containing protein [Flavobacteriaceae bacterium]